MSESGAGQQNSGIPTYDYDDRYYLKDNPNKKTDFPFSKNNKNSGDEKNDSTLSQDFYNKLTTQDPALGVVLDTDIKTATLDKHDLTETTSEKPATTDFFLEEPSDMSFIEVR